VFTCFSTPRTTTASVTKIIKDTPCDENDAIEDYVYMFKEKEALFVLFNAMNKCTCTI
jgi:hypothetical protein